MNSFVDKDNNKVFTIAHQITAATNAKYTINGIQDTSTSNKIDTIPGLTINLEKKLQSLSKLLLRIQISKTP